MQLDGNFFCGGFVFDSFDKASRDDDDNLDQIYQYYKKANTFGLFL